MGVGDSFEVVIKGSGSNVDEWRRAQHAPVSELRLIDLTAEQKHVAERFGVSLEDYARGILALRYGRERRESEGRALGQHVVELLRELGEGYRLTSVVRDADRFRWMLRIETPKQAVGVPVSYAVADDVIQAAVLAQIEHLRQVILEGVGRKDLVEGHAHR
jgi:hypothetical protein